MPVNENSKDSQIDDPVVVDKALSDKILLSLNHDIRKLIHKYNKNSPIVKIQSL